MNRAVVLTSMIKIQTSWSREDFDSEKDWDEFLEELESNKGKQKWFDDGYDGEFANDDYQLAFKKGLKITIKKITL